ncbi:MAG: glutamate 5-kinase [Planctomyces sp.]|nr:glutamate 5-kinase [Planctomyces sp.]MBA4119150.1 glutamate 5-kinase [Isosphaera sp.]
MGRTHAFRWHGLAVIKIGSAVLAPEGAADAAAFARLAEGVAAARGMGWGVVLVSSGAVACGFRALGLDRPPKTIARKQAAAAIGQPALMGLWSAALGAHRCAAAQVLLTADDLDARARFLNARRTLGELLGAGLVPVVNENDSVSFDEIKLGDNDRLSALVAGLVSAQLLLVLSSVDGVYEHGDARRVIARLGSAREAAAHVRPDKTATGVGGMGTKLEAASIASAWGIATVIARGTRAGVIPAVLRGEPVGTRVEPAARPRRARERWLMASARARGVVTIDDGARRAITERGASLLPAGVVGVSGDFARGAVVQVADAAGAAVARGVSAYSADELRRIKGLRAAQLPGALGHAAYCDEAIHRDDMALQAAARGS